MSEGQVAIAVDAMGGENSPYKVLKGVEIFIVPEEKELARIKYNDLEGYSDPLTSFINIMLEKSIEQELIIDDDYRKTKENQKQRYFYPLNQETNFKINKFSRTITKNKRLSSEILNIKGRNFEIKNFYEGISRFDFDDLCDQNLGSEDYLKIAENSNFMIIEKIPEFNEINSNQQQRFITLIDIIYDKKVPIAVTAKNSLKKFTTSKSLEEPFKRTISRLYELTSMDFKV